jgi:mevalonate kinase
VSLIYHSRIPAKLILFGEWGVLKNYPALGLALDKYFECTLEEGEKEGLEINCPECFFYWKKDDDNEKDEAPEFLKNSQEVLRYIFNDPLKVLNKKKLTLKRNWDLSEGLGSSSALFLALLILEQKILFQKNKFSQKEILSFQKKLIEFQGGGSGFDLLIQAYGGFVKINSSESNPLPSKLPPELLLVHTGKKMKTTEALQRISQDLHEKVFSEIGKSTENFFKNQNWELCIHEHFELLKMLGVIPPFVLSLQNEWVEKKWISCLKTTGAGGGDTLMLWTRTEHKKELLNDLKTKGYWIESAQPSSTSILDS